MCIYCYLKLSDNEFLAKINKISENNLGSWDESSGIELLIGASGFYGNTIRKKSFNLISEFYKWCLINKSKIILDISNLGNNIKYLKQNKIEYRDNNQLMSLLENIEKNK